MLDIYHRFVVLQRQTRPDCEDQVHAWTSDQTTASVRRPSTTGTPCPTAGTAGRVRMPLGALSRIRSTALGISTDWNVSMDGDVDEYRVRVRIDQANSARHLYS